ncbi:nucleic acid/nucleotide deaminase domain-containing protein [Streptomyces sp. R39]|uniref:Nucleic acid/nucleotide deaminase domain-containing protein n=1 Tax=Streptomyces sp. R39 TaxID=3238631 RepID=A0AB39R5B1_9ACTN
MVNRVKPGRNVAVYRIGSGEDSRFLVAANDPGGLHSKEILDNYLDASGISPDDVTEIYSERVPCSTDPHNCSARMGRYGNADVSWTLNPDGINNGAKNAGAIARGMGSYRGAPPGLPEFEWIG